jgi:hypothetical protein
VLVKEHVEGKSQREMVVVVQYSIPDLGVRGNWMLMQTWTT